MFCNRRTDYRIDKLYEQAPRLVYDDYKTSFSDLLAKGGSHTVHDANIQTLLREMYKIKHNLPESCVKHLFSAVNNNYNLHSQSDFIVPGINTVFLQCQFI